jgi:hypothetical protein
MNGWPLVEAVVSGLADELEELLRAGALDLPESLVAAALCAELRPNPYRRREEDAASVD